MKFLKKLYKSKATSEEKTAYAIFWEWFAKHEKAFYKTVKHQEDLEANFFDKLAPQLAEIMDGIFYLTGMFDENTAELIFTPDAVVEKIVIVEELVAAAPTIKGWKFTALKPATDVANLGIRMAGFDFESKNMNFYSIDYAEFPDEIEIVIVHDDFDARNINTIVNGCYIFLDNLLGELNSVTIIDNLKVIGPKDVQEKLIPIGKLNDFLIWREKEFIEKYEGIRKDTKDDNYTLLEGTLENGDRLIAAMNADLLEWDATASHPWILKMDLNYDGTENHGMPDEETCQFFDAIEDEMLEKLKDFEGYLNIGRQTGQNIRTLFFACKEFRKPSKVAFELANKYSKDHPIQYTMYKDKYWQSFERFRQY